MAMDALLAERETVSRDASGMAAQARAAADLMKALAHEGRLMILCHLVEGEKSRASAELEDLIGARRGRPFPSNSPACGSRASSAAAATARRSTIRSAYPRVHRLISTLHGIFCARP